MYRVDVGIVPDRRYIRSVIYIALWGSPFVPADWAKEVTLSDLRSLINEDRVPDRGP